MTADELHALPSEHEPFEGGFTTKDAVGNDAVWVHVEGDDAGVHLHQNVSAGVGGGSMSSYARLSPGEAYELAGALERAAQAADNYERNR